MNNNRINIIKHIEEKEQKDIFQDYEEIELRIPTHIGSNGEILYKIAYAFNKKYGCGFADVFLENVHNKFVRNSKEIANRIQYIKQSGYKFSCYNVVDNSLTIVFE